MSKILTKVVVRSGGVEVRILTDEPLGHIVRVFRSEGPLTFDQVMGAFQVVQDHRAVPDAHVVADYDDGRIYYGSERSMDWDGCTTFNSWRGCCGC